MLALSGAQRTGKTALAKAFSEATLIPYMPSRTVDIIKSMGLDITKPMDIETRFEFQDNVLNQHLEDVSSVKVASITDRSTLDFASYLMLEVGNECPQKYEDRVLEYVNKCLEQASKIYFGIVLVQPGIPFVVEENKYPPSVVRQELMNVTCLGLLNDKRCDTNGFFLQRNRTEIGLRVQSVVNIWNHITGHYSSLIQESTLH